MTGPTQQSFDPFGERYHDRLSECLSEYGGRDALYYNRLKARLLLRLARKHLGDCSNMKFLDLGCGTGLTEETIAGSFRAGAGIDLSREMLKARSFRSESCAFIQGDVTRIPFADHSFDLVFSVTLIHHLKDSYLQNMMEEIHRVIRPGGLMVHFDHNPYNFLTRRIVNRCEYDKDTTLRPVGRIASISDREGFRTVESGYLIFIPAVLEILEPLERLFKPIPLGGQYFFSATA